MNFSFNKLLLQLYATKDSIGVICNGIKANYHLNWELINKRIKLINKSLQYQIISGIVNNQTDGTPINIIVKNNDTSLIKEGIIRPNFADLIIIEKENGFFLDNLSSGYTIYPIAIIGLICEQIINNYYDIKLISHLNQITNLKDQAFKIDDSSYKDYEYLKNDEFPVIDPRAKNLFFQLIKKTKLQSNTLGGSIETIIYNLPKGLGFPFFNSFESIISHLLFSIPSLKGIFFGQEKLCTAYGSDIIDEVFYEKDQIITKDNNLCGINGGLTNGKPVTITTTFHPHLPMNKKINTINILKGENVCISSKTQVEPIIIHHFIPIIEGLISIVIYNFLT